MGKGPISLVTKFRNIASDIVHPKELRLDLFYVSSVFSIFSFFIAFFYALCYGVAHILCVLFFACVFTLLILSFMPIPEPKIEHEMKIEEHMELVAIKLSYKCNPILKFIYGEETLIKFVWDKSRLYDINELAKVVSFIHMLYNHSISVLWFIEYIFIPTSLAFLISELSKESSLFIASLFLNTLALIVKVNLKKGMEGKLNLLERMAINKPSAFGVVKVMEIDKDVRKAVKLAKKRGVVPQTVFLIRSLILPGGN